MVSSITVVVAHPVPPKDPPRLRDFAASGFAPGAATAVGELRPQSGLRRIRGKTLVQPKQSKAGFWVIQFNLTRLQARRTYRLHVKFLNNKGGIIVEIDVPGVKVVHVYGFGMTWPRTNGQVYTQFAPYGSQDEQSAISASLNPSAGFSYTQISNTANGWTISCNAPKQNGASLTVSKPQANPPPAPQTASNLSIVDPP